MMKQLPRHVLVVVASILAITEARAGWQYTDWGMSPERVVRASKGATQPVGYERTKSTFGQHLLAKGSFTYKAIEFEADFFFAPLSAGLSMVRLNAPTGDHCDALLGEMRAQYGQPLSEERGSAVVSAEWNDTARNNKVLYGEYVQTREFPRTCWIIYRPSRVPPSAGL